MTFLCVSCYFKGGPFLTACKEAGNTVYLLTSKHLEHEAWPRASIDEFFFMDDDSNSAQNIANIAQGMAWLLRDRRIDRLVALDDFDVEKAAYLREEFRLPGMGQTTARYFRDKLAMRVRAQDAGIAVPAFSPLFNNEAVNGFIARTKFPCLVKPRAEASATGIKKVHSGEELWQVINELGDDRHRYLVEQFRPGDVYHVDAISVDGEIKFCQVSRYLSTPFEVAHGGGIFRSASVPYDHPEAETLRRMTWEVMEAFGMQFSASHTEFIRTQDGQFVFLETASRVGGAHVAEMVEAATGISLWGEWARLETAMAKGESYTVPERRFDQSGILVSLSRFEWPDMSGFGDPEIVWKINKRYHVGMIVQSPELDRVYALLDDYAERVGRDFHASAPAPDKPTS
ncbi:MAG: ATP-grasp domain-containing protein [Bacteroidota bacterium]